MKISYRLACALLLSFILIFAASVGTAANNKLQQQIMPIEDGQLAYYRFGHGSPIVLITGYGATMSEWNTTFLQTLAKSHEVIVFDNRGVGDSHFSSTSYTMDDLSNDTTMLITGLHLQKPTVLGWSMGGMIAITLVIKHPELVGKLILMGSKIGGSTAIPTPATVAKQLTDTSGTQKERFNRVMRILFPEDAVPAMSKSFATEMFKPTGTSEAPVSGDVLQKQDLVRKDWETANDIPQQLQQLHIPTMILTGTRDAIVVPKNARILSEAIPNAELIEIQNGGHAMMYQYPVQIANLINLFINQK